MSTTTDAEGDLSVLVLHSSRLIESPKRPERARCYWEEKGAIYFYDGNGQLYAIYGRLVVKRGYHTTTIATVLLDNGFTEKSYPDEIICAEPKMTFYP